MDRRYSEMKLDGVSASDQRQRQSKALVADHLQRAKRQNRAALAYGGNQGSGSGFKSEPTEDAAAKARRMTAEAAERGLPPRQQRPRISRF
jgi:hypothetical protein